MLRSRLVVSVLLLLGVVGGAVRAERVYVLHDAAVPQVAYAARKLAEALEETGHEVLSERAGYERLISLAVHRERLGPEAFMIVPEGRVIAVTGGDARGVIYGTLALAEQVRNGRALAEVQRSEEKPHLEFRGIKFNLPWDTYRPSSSLDQHIP